MNEIPIGLTGLPKFALTLRSDYRTIVIVNDFGKKWRQGISEISEKPMANLRNEDDVNGR